MFSFDGEVVSVETMEDPKKREAFDMGAFFGRNGKDARYPSMAAVAKDLKKEYKKLGAIGFCYGGWVSGLTATIPAAFCLHLQLIGSLPAWCKGKQPRRRHFHRTPFDTHQGGD